MLVRNYLYNKFKIKFNFQKSSGFSVVEALVAIFIMSGIGLVTANFFISTDNFDNQIRKSRVAHSARKSILENLKNPMAWRQTVLQNATFACAQMVPGCSPFATADGFEPFVVYSDTAGDKISFDPTDLTTRYNLQGDKCEASITYPDAKCPIRYMARWKPVCSVYPCLNPIVEVAVTLETDFAVNDSGLNNAVFKLSLVKDPSSNSLQSACLTLDGQYNSITNTCYPKYAGKTCSSLGFPAQVVSAIDVDGNINCKPLYSGTCNPLTQVVTGLDSSGNAVCSPKVVPPLCPVDCVGGWGACSVPCGGGTQTYTISTPAANGGLNCPAANGDSQNCNLFACPGPVDCVGSWGLCSVPCGGGTQTYTVTTPESGGGLACPANTGDVQACNTGVCGFPIDCDGYWDACNTSTGQKSFVVTQVPLFGGAACPISPVNCPVDCVGAWSPCAFGSRAFSWTIPPLNGGLACPYANGATDSSGCTTAVCGPVNGTTVSAPPGGGLCNVGTPVGAIGQLVMGAGPYVFYQWRCEVSPWDYVWCFVNGNTCPASTTWIDAASCNGSVDFIIDTLAYTVRYSDNVDPVGTAIYQCNMNGSLSGPSYKECFSSPAPCNKVPLASTFNWAAGECVGPAPASIVGAGTVPHGFIDLVWDTNPDPKEGRATVRCVNGSLVVDNLVAYTCYIP